jgi:hypothetical protein
MSATSDKLRRVKVRIGDLERSVTNLEGRGTSFHALDECDRQQILWMLVKTLEAMKARRIVLERLVRSD